MHLVPDSVVPASLVGEVIGCCLLGIAFIFCLLNFFERDRMFG
jgi:hypothetical protein